MLHIIMFTFLSIRNLNIGHVMVEEILKECKANLSVLERDGKTYWTCKAGG